MAESAEDFSVHRFVQALFEDLSLTLPSLGCRFQGTVTPSALTVRGLQLFLKNKLFLLFADLASKTPELAVKFRPSTSGLDLSLGFFCEPFDEEQTKTFPAWDSQIFETFTSLEGNGFRFLLPTGRPIELGPPVNWRNLAQLYGGEANGKKVLDHFMVRCQTLIDGLKQALEANDSPTVLRLAHTLKGASRGITAQALAEAALQLEMLGRSGSLVSGMTLYEGLLATHREFVTWIHDSQN